MLERTIAISYGSLLYSVHFPNVFDQHGTRTKSRPSCSISKSNSSSLSININCTINNIACSKNPETSLTTSRAAFEDSTLKFPDCTVGIIGGVSTAATLHFLHKLVELSSQDGGEAVPFIVCNDPVLNIGNLHELRSRRKLIVEKLRERRVFLEKNCACCIVMPCHSLHVWHEEIVTDSSVPFLHIGECVLKELKAANLKPVEAGSNVRIGILSSDSSLTSRFYQDMLQNQGFQVIDLDRATVEHTVIPAIDTFRRKDMEGARNLLRIAIQVLLVKAVNTIIFASHDLSEILPQEDPLLKKCIDPIDSLAREAVRRAAAVDTCKV